MFEPAHRNRSITAWALLLGSGLAGAAHAGTDPSTPSRALPSGLPEGADFEVAAVAGHVDEHVGEGHVQHAYAQVLVVEPAYEEVVVSRLAEYCRETGPDNAQASRLLPALAGDSPGPSADAAADLHAASFEAEPADMLACEQRREEAVERQQVGYDVQYRYRGELFQSRLREDPGDRLRIRVQITPAPAG